LPRETCGPNARGRLPFSPGDELESSCWSTEYEFFKSQATNDVSLSYAMFLQLNLVQLGPGTISRLEIPSPGKRRVINNDTIISTKAQQRCLKVEKFRKKTFFSSIINLPAPSV
jgi:hypothetical protein